ncbi:MAG: hypothetical protein AB7G15_11670 [Alphaproteobacteria bacterium]
MDNGYSAREITTREADRMYPLVQLALAELSLDHWRSFVAATAKPKRPNLSNTLTGAPGGIVAVECARGYARALFSYSVVASLRCNRTLECDNLVILNQFGIRTIWATVLAAARDMARRYDCQGIHINMIDNGSELAELLQRAGFRPERESWCLRSGIQV